MYSGQFLSLYILVNTWYDRCFLFLPSWWVWVQIWSTHGLKYMEFEYFDNFWFFYEILIQEMIFMSFVHWNGISLFHCYLIKVFLKIQNTNPLLVINGTYIISPGYTAYFYPLKVSVMDWSLLLLNSLPFLWWSVLFDSSLEIPYYLRIMKIYI